MRTPALFCSFIPQPSTRRNIPSSVSRRCCATARLCGRRSPRRKAVTLTIRFSKKPIRAASLRCAARPRLTLWRQSPFGMCSATNATAGQRAPAMRAIRGIWQWPDRPRFIMRRPSKYQLRRSKTPAPSKPPTTQARWSGGTPNARIAASTTKSAGLIFALSTTKSSYLTKRPTRSRRCTTPAPAAAAFPRKRK